MKGARTAVGRDLEAGTGTAEQRFGEQVRLARELREWSQEELSKQLRELTGVTLHQSAIARIEGGKRIVRFNEAVALASVLDLLLNPYMAPPAASAEEYEQAKADLERIGDALEKIRQEIDEAQARHYNEMTRLQDTWQGRRLQQMRLRTIIHQYESRTSGEHREAS
jgi:transcriptional regulator with XRE-family HTH domain